MLYKALQSFILNNVFFRLMKNKFMYLIIIGIVLIFFIPFCSSAKIEGTLYDLALDPVDKGIVVVGSEPEQRLVAINGTFVFELKPGSYTIQGNAVINNDVWVAEEKIVIGDEGNYVFDLILEPVFDEGEISFDDESDLDLIDDVDYNVFVLGVGLLIIFIIVFLLVLFHVKNSKKDKKNITSNQENEEPREISYDQDEIKNKVIQVIKDAGGRITQKELRNKFSYSEAKVSLVLAELESEGRVSKIKKGRGNILVLK